MIHKTRVTTLEATHRKRSEHPSPAAVIVCLSAAEPEPALLAEVAAWTALPVRERRKVAPWGILTVEV